MNARESTDKSVMLKNLSHLVATSIAEQRYLGYGLAKMRDESDGQSRRNVVQFAISGGIMLIIGVYMLMRGILRPDADWYLFDIVLGAAAIVAGTIFLCWAFTLRERRPD